MTPEELPAYLNARRDVIRFDAAKWAADGMAAAFDRGIKKTEMRRYTHTPLTRTPSPPGSPPALVTGHLRDSFIIEPAQGGRVRATAADGPHTVYARIQEYGGDIYPRVKKWLHWVDAEGHHFAKHVRLPARPYMRPAAHRMSADGTLSDAALQSFNLRVWGR